MAESANPFQGGNFKPYGLSRQPSAREDTYIKGDILPIKKNTTTGQYSLAVPALLEQAYDTYTKVIRGEISPESPEAIEAAMTLSGAVGTGGMAASPKVGGPGTLGMFIGKRANTFDKEAEFKAYTMAKAGADKKEILKETGTRRWKSGSRQEIDDSKAAFTASYQDLPFLNTKLNQAIEHSELFKGYPGLSNVRVSIDDKLARGEAAFDPRTNSIYVSKVDVAINDVSPMLHEIQHWIQDFEGWPKGGNQKSFSPKELDSTSRSPNAKKNRPFLSPWEQYERLIGETEARATQRRKDYTDEQRRTILPEEDFTYMDSDIRIPLKDLNTEDYFNNLIDFDMSKVVR